MNIKRMLFSFTIIIHAVTICSPTIDTDQFIRNFNLPVLQKEADLPIYQIRSEVDLGGWTCGFFTLKNAKELEHYLGLNNPCDIKKECTYYLHAKGINPLDALNNKQLVDLADSVVRLRNFHALHINDHGIVSLMPEEINWNTTKATNIQSIAATASCNKHRIDITIEAPFETSNDQIETIAHEAANRELNKQLIALNDILNQRENGVLNFGCILQDETHVFLVSVIQLGWNQRAILVYDNLNKPYTDTPSRRNFVETIYKNFCI